MAEDLTFLTAIRPLFWLWRCFGFDLDPPNRPSLLRRLFLNFIFAFHLCQGVYLFWYAYASSERTPDKIQKMAMSFGRLLLGMVDLLAKLSLRIGLSNIVMLIRRCDVVVGRFYPEEQPFLKKLHSLAIFLLFYPVLSTSMHFSDVVEHNLAPERRLDLGDREFHQLIVDKPYLYYLLFFVAAPLCYMFMAVVLPFILVLNWTFHNLFDRLCDPHCPPSAVVEVGAGVNTSLRILYRFMALHRELWQLLKWANHSLNGYLMVWLGSQVLLLLVTARMMFFSGSISYSIAPMTTSLLILTILYIRLYSTINCKLEESMGCLMPMVMKLKGRHNATVCAKVDLYSTHVLLLDDPSLTAGGLIKFRPSLVPVVLGFVFSYNLYLFEKA